MPETISWILRIILVSYMSQDSHRSCHAGGIAHHLANVVIFSLFLIFCIVECFDDLGDQRVTHDVFIGEEYGADPVEVFQQ